MGRYEQLVSQTIEILSATDRAILDAGHFDLERLEELARTGKPYVRNNNELLLPLVLKRGENVINLRYTWN